MIHLANVRNSQQHNVKRDHLGAVCRSGSDSRGCQCDIYSMAEHLSFHVPLNDRATM